MRKDPQTRILAAILLSVLLFAALTVIASSHTSSSSLHLSARAAALYEPTSDTFLYEKNPDSRLPMASTTKIMTALVAVEQLPLSTLVEIDASAVGTEGSSLYLKNGEIFTLRELLYGLLLASANDAACAIACAVSGSIDAFAELMNARAAELGLCNTHFENPHGLDGATHYTTAHDLARIAAAFLAHPELRIIAATERTTISNTNGERRNLRNHNKLLTYYPGACGIKTGYTKRSGRSLVGAAERDGLTLISVTIDAPDDWNDHGRLLDYGFTVMENRTLADAFSYRYRLPVLGGTEGAVTVTNQEAFTVPIYRSASVQTQVCLPRYTVAPIQKGDAVGTVIFTREGNEIGRISLIAQETIPKKKQGIFSALPDSLFY